MAFRSLALEAVVSSLHRVRWLLLGRFCINHVRSHQIRAHWFYLQIYSIELLKMNRLPFLGDLFRDQDEDY